MLWVNYFSIIAQAAPMLGLLGTVSGMIKAFGTMGREGMGDPTKLATHISEALITTATGLTIAIPALFCFFVFRNRLAQLVGKCHDIFDELFQELLAAVTPDQQGAAPAAKE
jgi:biopolymer transport protein ExbB